MKRKIGKNSKKFIVSLQVITPNSFQDIPQAHSNINESPSGMIAPLGDSGFIYPAYVVCLIFYDQFAGSGTI